ncbi:MAG: hypothetical protein ACRDQA_16905 [Nocardioidaceae bacterium]
MTPLADASHGTGTAWLALLLLLTVVGYVAACAIWPFAACRRCSGSGKRRSPSGRAWRQCRRCHGTGRRVRIGRRLYDHGRHTHQRGTRTNPASRKESRR